MKCTHNRDLVFIRITLHKQNQTTVNRWRGVCVCLGGGQAVFPNILFSPPDGLERNYYVSDNQPITDIESTSGEGGAVSKPFNAHFFVSGHFSDI